MIRLKESEFNKVIPLLNEKINNKALIYSIVEGTNEGKIMVDDQENPTCAFIEWEFSFLIGKPSNKQFVKDTVSYIFHEMLPAVKEKEFVLFFADNHWDKMKKYFVEQNCICIERRTFHFNEKRFHTTHANKSIDGMNVNFKTYGENKFSFYLSNDQGVVSECKTVAVGGKEAEIDIFTNDEYRGRGYAFVVAKAFIEYCIEEGISPSWSCWPFRKESIHLAKKLGFDEAENVEALYWSESI